MLGSWEGGAFVTTIDAHTFYDGHDFAVVVGMICAIPQGVCFVRDRAGDTAFFVFRS
jgi:hypothetical protein